MRRHRLDILPVLVLATLGACGGGGGGGSDQGSRNTPPPAAALSIGPAACTGGVAADFRCAGLSLRARVPFERLGGSAGNDVWGWHDAATGKEYALVGMTTGTAFVDVSDPDAPAVLGTLPTATVASGWRDIKVYKDHAYVVADGAGGHGMQVFDLTRLRGVAAPQAFSADFRYRDVTSAHNLAINESTGFAYIVGSNTCDGGLHIVDLSTPASPLFAGCHALSDTHDTQCVVYRGPDMQHHGSEICFSSNEDHVEIVDVTDKTAPVSLATVAYPDVGYVHQGWLSENQSYFFVGDETDELTFGSGTRTIVLDVSDIDAPVYAFSYESPNSSTDHNLYVRGNRLYEGNYASGLRVIDIDAVSAGTLTEVAFFDTYPQSDAPGFDGVWSVYPYLPSGTMIVNDRDNGLFLLSMDLPTAFADADETAFERETVTFEGRVAGAPAGATWVQTSGTSAVVDTPSETSTTVTLPSLTAPEWLAFDLIVDDGAWPRSIDTVHVFVSPYPTISSVSLSDPSLQRCLDDLAATNGLEDVGLVTSLICANVGDVSGLDAFPVLGELVLSGSSFAGLSSLVNLPALRTLDLGGYTSQPCGELEALEAALGSSVSLTKGPSCRASTVSDLGGTAFDSALDPARRRLYVSVPERHEIVVASLDTTLIVDRILMPGEPHGIELSLDGTRLFAAVRHNDAVIEVDLDTGTQRTIPLDALSSDSRTHDVVEARADRLLVSADGRRTTVVEVRLDQADAVSRVGNEDSIGARPKLIASDDGQFVYVGDASSRSLYKLSLADPSAGVVLEGQAGSISGTDRLALDATGARIALASGQVLNTGSFLQQGSIPIGTPTVTESGDRFAVNVAANRIELFDALTLEQTGVEVVGCGLAGTADLFHAFDGDRSFALVDETSLCVTADVPLSTTLDPYPELHFTDISLESCARAAAQAQGWTSLSDFVSLDCSTSPGIRSLDGIESLTALTRIDISGSRVLDLEPLSALAGLVAIEARDTGVADLRPLQALASLSSVDLTGSDNVGCAALDGLSAAGISVGASMCADFRSLDLGGPGFDIEINAAGDRAFVSVPTLNSIMEVDLSALAIVGSFVASGRPNGIELSQDELTLYAALGDLGSIAYIDRATGIEQVVDLNAELGHANAHDIVELSAGRILVSASPNSGGLAYVVEVRRDLGNSTQRVAGQRVIRAEPEFAVAPDRSAVYVREGFSPPSVYKLDATQSSVPLIAEDDHGSLLDTRHLRISPDGSMLLMNGGQLVRTDLLTEVGRFAPGLSVFSADGASVLIEENGFAGVAIYDLATRHRREQRHWGCAISQPQRLVERIDGSALVLGDDLLCTVETVAR